ncbi:MAG: tetratricopeptide repeat protein [Acidobacteria bacterium]|nr:tetratricopeptide repeat protein [Acidobacteriota bacterium]MBI3654808.1 tetratricopeptide repeat protein [Acidobacteriota bacterium]
MVILLTYIAFALAGPLSPVSAKDNPKNKPDPTRSEQDKPVLLRGPEKTQSDPAGIADAKTPKEQDPRKAEYSLEIGNYYLKRKRFDAAIDRFREAIQYKPNYIEAYKLLSKAYEKKNDLAKAVAIYEEYLAKFPASGVDNELKREIRRLQNHNDK